MELPRHKIGDRMAVMDDGVQKWGVVTGIKYNGSQWVYTLDMDES